MVDLHIDEIDRLFEATGAEWAVPPRPAPPRRGPARRRAVNAATAAKPAKKAAKSTKKVSKKSSKSEREGGEGAAPSEEASPAKAAELASRLSVFEHAVASFDPTPSSILLWTRLSEDMTWASWTLARDPELTDVVASGGGVDRARPRSHRRRRRRRPRTGDDLLVPLHGGRGALAGRTHPHVARRPGRVLPHRHGVLRPVLRGAARRLPGARRAGGRPRAAPRRLHLRGRRREGPAHHDPPHTAITQDDYRRRLAQVRSDPDAQALHLRHPMVAIWDDHDLSDNAWRDGAKHHDPTRHGPWPVRVAAAAAARQEWLPQRLRDEADPKVTWRSIPIGDLAELVLLDTRLVGRDRQAGDEEGPPLDDPARSLLGDEQRAWVRERLLDMSRPWAIVASGVVVNSIELPWPRPLTSMNRLLPNGYAMLDGRVMHDDQWDGYPAERSRLVSWIVERAAAGGRTVLLSGDVHSSWAFTGPPDPATGEPVGGRVHHPGRLVGGDGSRPLPRAVARARSRRQRARSRGMVRRDRARLHDPRDATATRCAASGGSCIRTTRTRPPRPSWRRRS